MKKLLKNFRRYLIRRRSRVLYASLAMAALNIAGCVAAGYIEEVLGQYRPESSLLMAICVSGFIAATVMLFAASIVAMIDGPYKPPDVPDSRPTSRRPDLFSTARLF